jgi:pimeloyl-ACP methyl ester carboxylesterase
MVIFRGESFAVRWISCPAQNVTVAQSIANRQKETQMTRSKNSELMQFSENGKGLPVVLVHGFPLDRRIWEAQLHGLSDHHRIITVDLPGFGKSPVSGPFSAKSLADDLRGFLKRIDALPCVLGGLSMGGYVALAFAEYYAGDLKGLMLVDTRAEGDTPQGKEGRAAMIELARTEGSAAVADQMMPKMVSETTKKNQPAIVKKLQAIMEACPAKTIEYACAAMRDRKDYSTELGSIKTPTLVIVGEADAITPPSMAENMHRSLAGSKIAIIPRAGHMSPMEQPAAVTKAIGEFLQGIG